MIKITGFDDLLFGCDINVHFIRLDWIRFFVFNFTFFCFISTPTYGLGGWSESPDGNRDAM